MVCIVALLLVIGVTMTRQEEFQAEQIAEEAGFMDSWFSESGDDGYEKKFTCLDCGKIWRKDDKN